MDSRSPDGCGLPGLPPAPVAMHLLLAMVDQVSACQTDAAAGLMADALSSAHTQAVWAAQRRSQPSEAEDPAACNMAEEAFVQILLSALCLISDVVVWEAQAAGRRGGRHPCVCFAGQPAQPSGLECRMPCPSARRFVLGWCATNSCLCLPSIELGCLGRRSCHGNYLILTQCSVRSEPTHYLCCFAWLSRGHSWLFLQVMQCLPSSPLWRWA